jgi:hypothetical protein
MFTLDQRREADFSVRIWLTVSAWQRTARNKQMDRRNTAEIGRNVSVSEISIEKVSR